MSFTIVKANGNTEYFKVEKLRRSLRQAGAQTDEINLILETISAKLYDGMRTQEIYRIAFELLRQQGQSTATRYSLRRALFGLGPTGFPFERFLARLFEVEGYSAKTGIMIQGHCATHEIDVAAYKTDHSFVGEAKFHARPGTKTDLQVVMYAYARLLDLKSARICTEDICGIKEFWLITNTKFTTTAEKYAACAGIKLLSWDYPRQNNLHTRIEQAGIYPITSLTGLGASHVATLLQQDIIVCQDITAKPHCLYRLHLEKTKAEAIIAEAKTLCAPAQPNHQ